MELALGLFIIERVCFLTLRLIHITGGRTELIELTKLAELTELIIIRLSTIHTELVNRRSVKFNFNNFEENFLKRYNSFILVFQNYSVEPKLHYTLK